MTLSDLSRPQPAKAPATDRARYNCAGRALDDGSHTDTHTQTMTHTTHTHTRHTRHTHTHDTHTDMTHTHIRMPCYAALPSETSGVPEVLSEVVLGSGLACPLKRPQQILPSQTLAVFSSMDATDRLSSWDAISSEGEVVEWRGDWACFQPRCSLA